VTEFESVTKSRPGPTRQIRDSEQKRDLGFDDPGPAQHGTVTEVGVQADRARPGKNKIRMNLLIWALQLQLQSVKPINMIHCHLYAFHFYVYDMSRQVEAKHYCMHYNQDMRHCAILIRHLGCQTSWKHGLLRMQSFMSLHVYNGLHSLEVLDSMQSAPLVAICFCGLN